MIGFIGLGIMGKPMARNLLKAGVELMVYDINPAAVEALTAEGAAAGSPDAIGEKLRGGIYHSSQRTDCAGGAVWGEWRGIRPQAWGGGLRLQLCDTGGVKALLGEAPCDGSGICGRAGERRGAGSCGWNAGIYGRRGGEGFDALKPYFTIMGSSALLVGAPGSGSVTKLANQVIVNNTIAVVSEAFCPGGKGRG